MSQNLKTLKISFTPKYFKISCVRIWIMRKLWMLQNTQNNKKIKSSNKKRVLYNGTPASILMLLLFHTKKENKLWEIMLQYFSMNALHQALFSDLLLISALSTFVFNQMPNLCTPSCFQFSDVIYCRVLFLCFDCYTTICLQYSWCPSLLFSPSPSHQSQKGIHITLKLPFRTQAETISWNN